MQVPEEEREVYVKGQHLRGADAGFSEQTRAELVLACPSCSISALQVCWMAWTQPISITLLQRLQAACRRSYIAQIQMCGILQSST